MKPGIDIFELVKSLSKNEKRYFMMYAAMQKGNKNYLKLFEEINKQTVYDEKAIKENLKKEKFIKHFAFTKHYLYELMIKSLISYKKESSADNRIHALIMECKILFEKGLYRKYFDTLDKAKALSLKHERFGYLLHILDMQKNILRKKELHLETARLILDEAVNSLEQTKKVFEYNWLASRLSSSFRDTGILRDPQDELIAEEIAADPLMRPPQETDCIRAKDGYYRVKELIFNLKADYTNLYKVQKKRMGLIMGYPEVFEDRIMNSAQDILYSLAETCLKLKKHNRALEYLKMSISPKIAAESNEDIEKRTTVQHDLILFKIYLSSKEIKKAEALIPRLKDILLLFENKLLLDTDLEIRFNLVKCYLLAGKYSDALVSSNSLNSHPLLFKRADLESYHKIINLVIHFELKNFELLRYLLISAYRYLYKREKLFKLEQLILEFIRRLPGVKNEDDLDYNFKRLRKKLVLISRDKYEKNAFEYFDFIEWIDIKTGAQKG